VTGNAVFRPEVCVQLAGLAWMNTRGISDLAVFFLLGGIHVLSAFGIIPMPAFLFPAAACEMAGLFYKIH
jgi:hypothetical protein